MRYVEENFGDSDLARRFGVKRYPAIFVDDILFATPNDFGFYGRDETESGGRYAPLHSAESHDRFRHDLTRMIGLILQGRTTDARASAHPASETRIATFPEVELLDMDSRPITREDLQGRIVIVEFWATWCPPCRTSLAWLRDLKKRLGDEVTIITLAVQSDPEKVRGVIDATGASFRWAMSTPELARAFGDVSALPTMLLFDRKGGAVDTYLGAPPHLHETVEQVIESLRSPTR